MVPINILAEARMGPGGGGVVFVAAPAQVEWVDSGRVGSFGRQSSGQGLRTHPAGREALLRERVQWDRYVEAVDSVLEPGAAEGA